MKEGGSSLVGSTTRVTIRVPGLTTAAGSDHTTAGRGECHPTPPTTERERLAYRTVWML